MNLKETATFLGLSPKALYHYVEARAIPHRRLGSRILFSREELERWMERLPGVSVEEALSRFLVGNPDGTLSGKSWNTGQPRGVARG